MSPLRVGGFESRRVLKDAFPLLHLIGSVSLIRSFVQVNEGLIFRSSE